jgi:hypothetical protein
MFAFLCVAGGLTACARDSVTVLDPTGPAFNATTDPDTMLSVIGNARLEDETDLVVTAIRHFNGSVTGQVVLPSNQGAVGEVFEVVPPHDAYDHWCVGIALVEVPGFNALMYLRDVGDGLTSFDQVRIGGDFGATCATHPAPELEFADLEAGDYRTRVRAR